MAVNQVSMANLKPYKKGQSGNPAGRTALPDIKEAVAKVLVNKKDGKEALERVFDKMLELALDGNVNAAKEMFDRAYGKAQQTIENTNIEKKPDIVVGSEDIKKKMQKLKEQL